MTDSNPMLESSIKIMYFVNTLYSIFRKTMREVVKG
jgi:hypothetical protein